MKYYLAIILILISLPFLLRKERVVYREVETIVLEIDTVSGGASYYDYVLDDGWSSVGHLVCATRDWERYSYIEVTNIDNGKSVVCRVTDYGPDASVFPERIVDLSSYAFSQIADLKLGVIDVLVTQEIE